MSAALGCAACGGGASHRWHVGLHDSVHNSRKFILLLVSTDPWSRGCESATMTPRGCQWAGPPRALTAMTGAQAAMTDAPISDGSIGVSILVPRAAVVPLELPHWQ